MIKHQFIKSESDYDLYKWLSGNSENTFLKSLYEKLKSKSNLKILDLGARVPQSLMICYHEFDTALLRGVDIVADESSCLVSFANHLFDTNILQDINFGKQIINKCFTYYDFYKIFIKDVSTSHRNIPLDEFKFNELITNNYYFNTKAEDYLNTENEKFDFIICHNILHFLDQKERYVEKLNLKLVSGGTIVIRVENQSALYQINERTYYNKELFLEEVKRTFSIGHIYEKVTTSDWESLIFINCDNQNE